MVSVFHPPSWDCSALSTSASCSLSHFGEYSTCRRSQQNWWHRWLKKIKTWQRTKIYYDHWLRTTHHTHHTHHHHHHQFHIHVNTNIGQGKKQLQEQSFTSWSWLDHPVLDPTDFPHPIDPLSHGKFWVESREKEMNPRCTSFSKHTAQMTAEKRSTMFNVIIIAL